MDRTLQWEECQSHIVRRADGMRDMVATSSQLQFKLNLKTLARSTIAPCSGRSSPI